MSKNKAVAFLICFLLTYLLVTANSNTFFNGNHITNNYFTPPNKIITGKVTNIANGNPLEGVTVKLRGGKLKTSTKADGTFTMNVPEDATLEFSMVGFEVTTAKASSSDLLNIKLKESPTDLSEVVVVAYGSQKKSSYTGAVSVISRDVTDDKSSPSFEESLQGNATGVFASNGSGQPGSAPSIRIRGVGSILASAGPLYVVDGIPIIAGDVSNGLNSNAVAAINPNDIQSLAILKDAAATALYGSRGANGVILVTTKKGKALDKTLLSGRVQTGVDFYTLDDTKARSLSTSQMIQYLRDGWANNPIYASLSFDSTLAQTQIDTTVNTDWFNKILQVGQYQNVLLSATGGSEKTSFYISGNYNQQQGAERSLNYQKIGALANITHKATDKLTFNVGVSVERQIGNNTLVGGENANPIRAMYTLQSWLKPYNADGSYNISFNNANNPLGIINNNIRRATSYFFRGFANAVYKFNNHFSYELNAGIDFSHAFNLIYNDPSLRNVVIASNGYIENYSSDINNQIITHLLRYKKDFNPRSNLETFAGYEFSKVVNTYFDASGTQLGAAGIYGLSNSAVPAQPSGAVISSAIISQFLNAVYTLDNRYYLSGSIRNDESSKFSIKNAIFWSVGAGWEITKERFFNVRNINQLKIRGSYGLTGNSQGLSANSYQALYTTTSSYNNEAGITFSQLRNDSLSWEKNYPLNLGLDASFFKNRLSLVFDWYTRRTDKLITNSHSPAVNGLTLYPGNYGSMRNRGFEVKVISVNIQPARADGFKWTTEVSFSTNQNTILQIDRPSTTNDYRRKVGVDFYQWYLYTYAGVDSSNGQALWYSDAAKTKKTNNYNNAALALQGSAMPKFFGGILNRFSYKNFSFMVQLFYNYGNKIYDLNGPSTHSDGSKGINSVGNVNVYDFIHRWRKPGDITDVPAPVIYGSQTGLSSQASTRFLYDGSYLRVRDVMLSYKLPAKFVAKTRTSDINVYARASNLLTWAKDKRLPYDPETGIDGTLQQRPPVYRTILLGVNIDF